MQTNFITKNKNIRIKSLIDNTLSHHTLGAFLSGTDLETLRKEGCDTNCFVSLVVDTKKEYVAAITRQVAVQSEVSVKNIKQSHTFFGEGEKHIELPQESSKIIDTKTIEYFMLDVEVEDVDNPLEYLDKRFEEIQKDKEEHQKISETKFSYPKYRIPENSIYQEGRLWGNDYDWDYSLNKKDSSPDSDIYVPDKNLIHKAAVQIVTCSMIIDTEKFDMKQWITRHLDKKYSQIFSPNIDENLDNMSAFHEWADFIIDFSILHFADSKVPCDMDMDEYYACVAEAIIEELSPYGNSNRYIAAYCEKLSNYLF